MDRGVPFLVVLTILGVLWVSTCYKTNSLPIMAVAQVPIEQVEAAMDQTDYLEFLTELGRTTKGEVIFTFRWSEFGWFTTLSASGEEEDLVEDSLMLRLSDYDEAGD